jgi:hypothetical protein
MSDFPEAIGGPAEGALLARAVEPRRGEAASRADGHTHETACLNCGTELIGPHCHGCGQPAHVHRTIGAFLHDLLHGALHFEGKTWRTLPMLAFRPGELTRRYIEGERARFVSPMALFLFTVFLMFAVFQIAGISPPTDFSNVHVNGVDTGQGSAEALKGLREARRSMADDNPGSRVIDAQIAAIEKREAETKASAAKTPAAGDTTALTGSADGTVKLSEVRTGSAFIDHGIEKWQKNPGLMLYKLQSNSYKFSWLLIPLSIPFVWLIFAWRRKFGAYDHAVFVTYSLSFMTLFFVALTLLGMAGVGAAILGTATGLVPLLHIYKQLRGAYSLSRFSALWRTAALSVFIVVILLLFLNLLLVLGALG